MAGRIRDAILKNSPSPITYNSPKPQADHGRGQTHQAYRINVKPEDVVIVPVAQVFQ